MTDSEPWEKAVFRKNRTRIPRPFQKNSRFYQTTGFALPQPSPEYFRRTPTTAIHFGASAISPI